METPPQRIHYLRTTNPTVEPLSIEEAVRHLQLAVSDDTGYIQGLIQSARDVIEDATGRALMSSIWMAACEDWPESFRLELSIAPVASITSVKYYAYGEATLTTVSSADYTLSSVVTPATICFDEDFTFPDLADRPDAVQVVFVAGATLPSNVPPALKHAMRILIRHFYDHPEAVVAGNFDELPFGLKHLLESHRVSGWVA